MTDALPSPESFFLVQKSFSAEVKRRSVLPLQSRQFSLSENDGDFRVRGCQTTDRDSCREPGRRGMFHAGTLRR
jgi:hypothetical protein